MTKQRALILQLIRTSPRHLTAEEIYRLAKEQMPTMVFATVYNNLHALEEAGQVVRIHVANGADHYDKTVTPHYHLLCDGCGDMQDLICPNLVPTLEIANRTRIRGLDLVAHCICEKCEKARPKT